MAAATAILYAAEDPSVAGMVLDSPFADLVQLCEEVAQMAPVKVRLLSFLRFFEDNVQVPKGLLKSVGLPLLRKSIQKRAGFDIGNCSPVKLVDRCFVPALFCHGSEDVFIAPRHSEQLHAAYAGGEGKTRDCHVFLTLLSAEKNRILVAGGHNTVRPAFLRDSASIFFAQCLGLEVADRPEDFFLPVGLHANEMRMQNVGNDLPDWGAGLPREEEGDADDAEMAAAIAMSLAEGK
jgi:hypothetical protein